MSENNEARVKVPILKESDIAQEPEKRVERHQTWSLKFENFLNTVDGYTTYLRNDLATVTADWIAANPAPARIDAATLAINIAAYVADPQNIAAATGLLRNAAGQANILAYVTKEADKECKIEQARVELIYEAYQKKLADVNRKERKCFAYLISALEEPLIIKYQISMLQANQQTPIYVWNLIHDDFHRIDAATRLYYSNKYEQLKFEPNETIKSFGVRVRQASNHLLSAGIVKDDNELKTAFMSKVRNIKKYTGVIANALNYPADTTFEDMCATLQNQVDILLPNNEEIIYHDSQKRKRHDLVDPKPKRKLLKLQAGGKRKTGTGTCSHCGKNGHTVDNCWDKHPEKAAPWFRTLTKSSKVKKVSKQTENDSSSDTSEEKTVDTVKTKSKPGKAKVRMTSVLKVSRNNNQNYVNLNIRNDDNTMIMDSGSESTVLKKIYPGVLEGPYDSNLTLIYGDGVQDHSVAVGNIGELQEVAVSNKITDNILSLSQMADLGYTTIITSDKMYLLKPGYELVLKKRKVAITGTRVGNLYKCELMDVNNVLKNVEITKNVA